MQPETPAILIGPTLALAALLICAGWYLNEALTAWDERLRRESPPPTFNGVIPVPKRGPYVTIKAYPGKPRRRAPAKKRGTR